MLWILPTTPWTAFDPLRTFVLQLYQSTMTMLVKYKPVPEKPE